MLPPFLVSRTLGPVPWTGHPGRQPPGPRGTTRRCTHVVAEGVEEAKLAAGALGDAWVVGGTTVVERPHAAAASWFESGTAQFAAAHWTEAGPLGRIEGTCIPGRGQRRWAERIGHSSLGMNRDGTPYRLEERTPDRMVGPGEAAPQSKSGARSLGLKHRT